MKMTAGVLTSCIYFRIMNQLLILMLIKFKIIRSLNSSVSLIIYDGFNDSLVDKINDMGDELVSSSTTKGYVVITGSLIILNESVPRFANSLFQMVNG